MTKPTPTDHFKLYYTDTELKFTPFSEQAKSIVVPDMYESVLVGILCNKKLDPEIQSRLEVVLARLLSNKKFKHASTMIEVFLNVYCSFILSMQYTKK